MRQAGVHRNDHELATQRTSAAQSQRRTVKGAVPTGIPIQVTVSGDPPQDVGVYVISVAARLLEMHPQTLRKYERAGLVTPSRSEGLLRLYSDQDLNRLRMVKHLVDHWGMNLAGVEVALELLDRMLDMQQRLLPMVRTSDNAAGVVRETWREVVRTLGLPDAVDAGTEEDDPSLERGDYGDDPSQRPRARRGGAPGPDRRRWGR